MSDATLPPSTPPPTDDHPTGVVEDDEMLPADEESDQPAAEGPTVRIDGHLGRPAPDADL